MPQYYYSSRPSISLPPAVLGLLVANIAMYMITLVAQNFMVSTFALFYPTSPLFRWWQPVTHMFMHGGFWHIFFNMYTLFVFGCTLERTIGTRKFLIFYFVCGLGAAALHMAVQSVNPSMYTPVLGASGAIYGVLLGFAMLYPEARMMLIFPPIAMSAKWMVVVFAGIELFTGVTGTADGIAHFAHLGGMLFGYLLILFWKKRGTLYNQY